MEVSRDQNDHYFVDKSINDKLFNDEVQTYNDVERAHRDSADSCSSERTLYDDPRSVLEGSTYTNSPYSVSYFDLKDAFESSIYDKPEVHACDCAAKFALKNNSDNDELSENQNKPAQNEPQQEQSQSKSKLQPQQSQSQPQPPQNNFHTNNEVYLLFIFVSVISYGIGHFGFTSVWLMIILYQSIKWYINVTKDYKDRKSVV